MKGRVLLFTGAAALMLLAACGDDSSSGSNTTSAPAASGGGGAATTATSGSDIVAKDIAYNPTELTVKVGGTVTFKNEDGFAHTFTANNGEFDSGNVDGGASFTFTPDKAGTIAFHCKIHSNMKGTLTVEA